MTIENILLSLLSAIVGGLIVAFANHLMARTREIEKKTTDIRVDYLIECCLKIEGATCPGPNARVEEIEKGYRDIEQAFAKIILLGDPVEVEAVKEFGKNFSSSKHASLNKVLNALRDSLRKKLGLEHAGNWDLFLRIDLNNDGFNSSRHDLLKSSSGYMGKTTDSKSG